MRGDQILVELIVAELNLPTRWIVQANQCILLSTAETNKHIAS